MINNYCVGIISTIVKKKILNFNRNIFNENYNHIGDFDLFMKLSKKHKFGVIQSPVATYRVHGNNLSLINRGNEIKELKHWLKKNKKQLKYFEKKLIEKKIEQKNFINTKLKGNFYKSAKLFFMSKDLRYNIKYFILLFLPTNLLKKIMWYA